MSEVLNFSFPYLQGDCIPIPKQTSKSVDSSLIHVPVESIDGAQLDQSSNEANLKHRIRDLEEQTKLIPLLQIQIQALRDERHQLQSLLESRASSSSSASSPHHQPVFQAHRVSPVSLNSYKIPPVAVPKRNVGVNTTSVLYRDVGCSPPDVSAKTSQRGVSTDLVMKIEGDGGRFYTERDLKKAIEMAHAKMRKTSATVGTQFGDKEREK